MVIKCGIILVLICDTSWTYSLDFQFPRVGGRCSDAEQLGAVALCLDHVVHKAMWYIGACDNGHFTAESKFSIAWVGGRYDTDLGYPGAMHLACSANGVWARGYVGACDCYWSDVLGYRCTVVCNWCNGAVGSGLCCLDLHYRVSDVDWTIGAYL